MVIAMLLAHLVGDYLLQWDELAQWKSRAFRGVLVHGGIVFLVTLIFCLLFNPAWWFWAVFIGVTHTAIDAVWLGYSRMRPGVKVNPLGRLLADQALHLIVIAIALVASGSLTVPSLARDLPRLVQANRMWVYVLGYVFITMPAWILVEFTVYGLVAGTAPNFSEATNKYVGILERGLITTFVLVGQFALVPLVTLPRLIFEGPQVVSTGRIAVYAAELLTSVSLAVVVGVGLRMI